MIQLSLQRSASRNRLGVNSILLMSVLASAIAAPQARSSKCSIAARSAGADMADEIDSAKPARTDKAILEEARGRLQRCIDDHAEQRKLQLLDLKFATLDQWPAEIRAAREDPTQPGGPRPCLTLDKINQYVTQVVNDMPQNRPAIKVRPVDDFYDVATAEVLQALARHHDD